MAGYHLARLLQEFPAGSRVGLIGHSHGGLVVLSALHLLGGGTLDDDTRPYRFSGLPGEIPTLRLRAVVIASASDRQWLAPGERFDRALEGGEAVLSLYNPLDPVLVLHPFGRCSDHRRAMGQAGLRRLDEGRLGPLAARYRERNIASFIGANHTFRGTTVIPPVAGWIGSYTWAADAPSP